METEYITTAAFVSHALSFRKGALTQTNRKSSLCLSYLEKQLVKLKWIGWKNKPWECCVELQGEEDKTRDSVQLNRNLRVVWRQRESGRVVMGEEVKGRRRGRFYRRRRRRRVEGQQFSGESYLIGE